MDYTADSWFFIQLVEEKEEKAGKIWREFSEGKSKLVIPTIVVAELCKRFLRKNLSREFENFVEDLEKSEKIITVDLTPKIAFLAGRLGHTYNMPTEDSVILATAISTGHINILTSDEHFILPARQDKIRIIKF